MNYKCQNCGSPLVFEEGQDRTICKYCRSQNVMTIGADGQITLSLVQTINSIDSKTDQLLAMQKAASMGHLLAATTSEYQHFLQNEFKPRMVALEEEKNKIGKYGGGCGCAAIAVACLVCVPMALAGLGSGDPGGFIIGLIFGGIAAGVIYAVMSFATQKRNLIQAKMDEMTQKRSSLEKQSNELKKTMSGGH